MTKKFLEFQSRPEYSHPRKQPCRKSQEFNQETDMNLLVYRRCVISLLTALTVSVSLGLSGCGGDAPGSSGAAASLESQQAPAAPPPPNQSAAPPSRRPSRHTALGPPPSG